jgi:hypothetical protein
MRLSALLAREEPRTAGDTLLAFWLLLGQSTMLDRQTCLRLILSVDPLPHIVTLANLTFPPCFSAFFFYLFLYTDNRLQHDRPRDVKRSRS